MQKLITGAWLCTSPLNYDIESATNDVRDDLDGAFLHADIRPRKKKVKGNVSRSNHQIINTIFFSISKMIPVQIKKQPVLPNTNTW